LTNEDYRGVGAIYFAEQVEEMSGGNMTITVFPSETLTTSQNMIQMVSGGSAEMGAGSLSFAAAVAPELAALDIPGTYDPTHFRETYSEIRDLIDEILEPHGVKLMIMFDETDSVFYLSKSNARQVHDTSDIAGLRIRDHGLWLGRTLSAWGANPMTVVTSEMAVALERGTVDGGYTGWGFMNVFRLYESAPAITFANMSKSAWGPITVNLQLWNSLTQAQRDILTEAARKTEELTDQLIADAYVLFLKNVEEAGGTIYQMSPEETAEFIKLAEPVIQQARDETGALGNKLIDKMIQVRDSFK
jgi:C4-dicarboxylate-binding protein DctP